jgi:electron transfer flavoprotein alpha subunit
VNGEKKPEVWVVTGALPEQIDDASLELVREGRGLSERLAASLAVLTLGGLSEEGVTSFGRNGAEIAYVCYHLGLSDPQPDVYLPVLEEAVRQHQPRIILFPSTREMQVLAARLGARLGVAVASDCTKLDIDGDGHLAINRPAYGNRLSARMTCLSAPAIATFQAGYGKRPALPSEPQVRPLKASMAGQMRSVIEAEFRDPPGEMDLPSAEIIVSGGRGVGGAQGFAMLAQLAQLLGGAVAASRGAVDSGWVPAHRQVGLSGKTVSPKLYIACGISGATHHVVGMKDARSVIAINNDRSAPIFKIADVAILGDLHEVIPQLLRKLENAGSQGGLPQVDDQ